MSLQQPTNTTKTEFTRAVNDGSWRPLQELWSDATGTAFWVKLLDGGDLVVLIQDATPPIIVGQRGSISLTIPAGSSGINQLITLPTPLDSVANWLGFGGADIAVLGTMLTATVHIVSVTQIRVFLVRDRINVSVAGNTGNESSGSATGTEQPPNTLLNHQHFLSSVDDPLAIDHQHPYTSTSIADSVGQPAQTATVNWVLIHA